MPDTIFSGIEKGPAIEVFALNRAFVEDTHPQKANLGVGGKLKRKAAAALRIASDDNKCISKKVCWAIFAKFANF